MGATPRLPGPVQSGAVTKEQLPRGGDERPAAVPSGGRRSGGRGAEAARTRVREAGAAAAAARPTATCCVTREVKACSYRFFLIKVMRVYYITM